MFSFRTRCGLSGKLREVGESGWIEGVSVRGREREGVSNKYRRGGLGEGEEGGEGGRGKGVRVPKGLGAAPKTGQRVVM